MIAIYAFFGLFEIIQNIDALIAFSIAVWLVFNFAIGYSKNIKEVKWGLIVLAVQMLLSAALQLSSIDFAYFWQPVMLSNIVVGWFTDTIEAGILKIIIAVLACIIPAVFILLGNLARKIKTKD